MGFLSAYVCLANSYDLKNNKSATYNKYYRLGQKAMQDMMTKQHNELLATKEREMRYSNNKKLIQGFFLGVGITAVAGFGLYWYSQKTGHALPR